MKSKAFASRDEQEVAGYADAMDIIFQSFDSITPTENHICGSNCRIAAPRSVE
jgi:hypothetical protein